MTIRLPLLLMACLTFAAPAFGQRGPASVGVSEIQLKVLASGQSYVGTILPSKYSSVGAAVDGRVSEIHVDEGDFVEKRKPLAQLLTETITLQRDAAQAELEFRKYELAELENGSRPEEIAQANAKMLEAKAFHAFRLAQRHRNEQLFKDEAIGEDALHEVQAEADVAEQLEKHAEEVLKMVKAGPRAEKILQAQARVAMHTAMVRNLESRIGKHTLFAPFDGYVVARPSEEGEWIKQGDLVADIVALDYVDVLLNVLEKHVTHISRGMEIRVEIPAIPDHFMTDYLMTGGQEMLAADTAEDWSITGTGEVILIVAQADVRTRTFPVKVRIKNTILPMQIEKPLLPNGPLVKSGMLARAMLPIGPEHEALLVPKDALVLGGATPIVFVVDAVEKGKADSGKVRPVPVKLGVASGRLIEVRGDVKAGDRVVVRGNERLRPGQDVIITEVLDPNAEPQAKATGN